MAIAVDNLANAHELTKDEEEEQAAEDEVWEGIVYKTRKINSNVLETWTRNKRYWLNV